MTNEQIISVIQRLRNKIFNTQFEKIKDKGLKHECNSSATILFGQIQEVSWYLNTLLLQLDGTLPDDVEYIDFEYDCCKKARQSGEKNDIPTP